MTAIRLGSIFVLSGMLGGKWSWIDLTVQYHGRYGLTMWLVLEERHIFSTVLTVAGDHTTVFIANTSPSVATMAVALVCCYYIGLKNIVVYFVYAPMSCSLHEARYC